MTGLLLHGLLTLYAVALVLSLDSVKSSMECDGSDDGGGGGGSGGSQKPRAPSPLRTPLTPG